jgi:hypothetical protein
VDLHGREGVSNTVHATPVTPVDPTAHPRIGVSATVAGCALTFRIDNLIQRNPTHFEMYHPCPDISASRNVWRRHLVPALASREGLSRSAGRKPGQLCDAGDLVALGGAPRARFGD